jgi:hypothetical protein
LRLEDSAGQSPEHARPGPGHAFEETAAVNAVFVVIVFNYVGHIFVRVKVYWICSLARVLRFHSSIPVKLV